MAFLILGRIGRDGEVEIMLQSRSASVRNGSTWGLPGGSVEADEKAAISAGGAQRGGPQLKAAVRFFAALREADEECGSSSRSQSKEGCCAALNGTALLRSSSVPASFRKAVQRRQRLPPSLLARTDVPSFFAVSTSGIPGATFYFSHLCSAEDLAVWVPKPRKKHAFEVNRRHGTYGYSWIPLRQIEAAASAGPGTRVHAPTKPREAQPLAPYVASFFRAQLAETRWLERALRGPPDAVHSARATVSRGGRGGGSPLKQKAEGATPASATAPYSGAAAGGARAPRAPSPAASHSPREILDACNFDAAQAQAFLDASGFTCVTDFRDVDKSDLVEAVTDLGFKRLKAKALANTMKRYAAEGAVLPSRATPFPPVSRTETAPSAAGDDASRGSGEGGSVVSQQPETARTAPPDASSTRGRFQLHRFTAAQRKHIDGQRTALQELCRGEKRSCWIWWIVPVPAKKEMSTRSRTYAISCDDEAAAFLAFKHDGCSLRDNLLDVFTVTLEQIKSKALVQPSPEGGGGRQHAASSFGFSCACALFGGVVDAKKLMCSLVLWRRVSAQQGDGKLEALVRALEEEIEDDAPEYALDFEFYNAVVGASPLPPVLPTATQAATPSATATAFPAADTTVPPPVLPTPTPMPGAAPKAQSPKPPSTVCSNLECGASGGLVLHLPFSVQSRGTPWQAPIKAIQTALAASHGGQGKAIASLHVTLVGAAEVGPTRPQVRALLANLWPVPHPPSIVFAGAARFATRSRVGGGNRSTVFLRLAQQRAWHAYVAELRAALQLGASVSARLFHVSCWNDDSNGDPLQSIGDINFRDDPLGDEFKRIFGVVAVSGEASELQAKFLPVLAKNKAFVAKELKKQRGKLAGLNKTKPTSPGRVRVQAQAQSTFTIVQHGSADFNALNARVVGAGGSLASAQRVKKVARQPPMQPSTVKAFEGAKGKYGAKEITIFHGTTKPSTYKARARLCLSNRSHPSYSR